MLVRRTSTLARLAMALPFRFYAVESARVGQDTTTWVRVFWR